MSVHQEQEFNQKQHFDWVLWKKLFGYVKPYKKLVITLSLIMVGTGVIEASLPMLTKYAVDRYIVAGNLAGVEWFGLTYLVLIGVQAALVWFLIAIASRIEQGVCYDIRNKGFRRLQELSFSYFDKTPTGWIMARMTSDIVRLSDTLAWGIVDATWGGAMMVFITCYMFYLNWKIAMLVLVVIPPLAAISVIFQRKILQSFRVVRKTNSKITAAFNEGIMGAKTTKTLVVEAQNLSEFKQLTDTMYKSSVMAAVLSAVYMPIVLTLGGIGTAFALWYGGNGVLGKTISYGTLVAFISYTVQFFDPVTQLARILAELISAQASGERIVSMIETSPEIADGPEVVKKYGDMLQPQKENWEEINGDISLSNVSFKYKDGETVFENLNLQVPAGHSVALVGETGSGKSTLVNLVCRFYEPTNGEILIDGADYRHRSQFWLQSNIGYVLQVPHLFNGTVAENIRYGRLTATDDEVMEAAKLVNAHEFITKLEKGYQTEVGEGGSRLSTGQKQLISLARAILAKPKIFVLDEATSSVDTETEQIIQNAIHKALKGRTSFIIAHRLSTIRSADKILVMHNGKIVEEGKHQTLLNNKGYYYNLYTNQFRKEEAAKLLKSI